MSVHPPPIRRLAALSVCVALAFGTTALAASPAWAKGKKHTTTKHSKHKHTSKTTSPSKTVAAKTTILKLETKLKGQKQATFIATYKLTDSGSTQSITFAQDPPKSLFKSTSGSVIDTGTATLFCSTTQDSTPPAGATCLSSSGTDDPMASLIDLFSATTALEFFNGVEAEAAAKAAGVTLSFSSGTFGGLASQCVTASDNGQSGKYCVASVGILDYWSASGSSATLVSYSGSIPAGTFTPPAGATVTTEP